jgi:hypothetical protein
VREWSLIVGGVAAGVGLIAAGNGLFGTLSSVWSVVTSTLGGTIVSAAAVGIFLNVVWWQKWTRRALADLFSDRDWIASLGLERKALRARLVSSLCAVYGTSDSLPNLRKLLAEDVLEKLAYPLRRNFRISVRLSREEREGFDLVRQATVVEYSLHFTTPESRENAPFQDNVVLRGFVDVPEALLIDWQTSGNGAKEPVDVAHAALRALVDRVQLVSGYRVVVDGASMDPDTLDLRTELSFPQDGSKPRLEYVLRYSGTGPILPPKNSQVALRFEYAALYDTISTSLFTVSRLTDGFEAHVSYSPAEIQAELYRSMPSDWPEVDVVQSTNPHLGEIDLRIARMLLPGNGVVFRWYRAGLQLSSAIKPGQKPEAKTF